MGSIQSNFLGEGLGPKGAVEVPFEWGCGFLPHDPHGVMDYDPVPLQSPMRKPKSISTF